MYRHSKVAWTEGLFLEPHHFQQADRHLAREVAARRSLGTPYPWGFESVKVRTAASSISLSQAKGFFPDGLFFDAPSDGDLPPALFVTESDAGSTLWLTVPDSPEGSRALGMPDDPGTRYILASHKVPDEAISGGGPDVEIQIAVPRLELYAAKEPRTGHQSLALGVIKSVSDGEVTLDVEVPPVALTLAVHDAYRFYLEDSMAAVDARARELAHSAVGAGLRDKEYLLLLVLNRTLPVLQHLKCMAHVHPERLFEVLVSLSGELSTFVDDDRTVSDGYVYDHDQPEKTFSPLVLRIRGLLRHRLTKVVQIPHEPNPHVQNFFRATAPYPDLFRTAVFYLKVAASAEPSQVLRDVPINCKIASEQSIERIINYGTPGLSLTHMPTPPPQLRTDLRYVYFRIEKSPSEFWAEFSSVPSMYIHFTGPWPGLEIELWAVPEGAA